MTLSSIWIGIGAFILAMLGTVSIDASNRDVALSSLSIGGPSALAKQRRGGPNILDTLDDLDLLDPDEDADADDDAAADAAPRQKQRQSGGEKSACEERARHADPTGQFAGSPCWARETFGSGTRRR